MANSWAISYIVGLTPKIVFIKGQFMFPKGDADKIAGELRKNNPSVEFKVSNLQPAREAK